MIFEESNIYHIYNRTNNHTPLFYSRENYLFFLEKFKHNILPFSSILAWCLMPTHFHIMVYVNKIKIENRKEDLNSSIGKMMSSYTRSIQKQEKITGSIFQSHTKAKCLNQIENLSPSFWNKAFGTQINIEQDHHNYPLVCFNYIHMNPVADRLVQSPEEWEFSSYRDYFDGRNGKLINYDRAKSELGIDKNIWLPTKVSQ
ncbi:putative transposase [Ancylomarina subtilis]|uniref:Putative transposase n=1 Tax=Ancylomarina subtilis TaxID=1639035 RepID=A0A4Q7VIH0_9BACT|nr:transposase [Ancylomarina subtilis]RZT95946.1 putative transposase [Ancylomarina subtilis]